MSPVPDNDGLLDEQAPPVAAASSDRGRPVGYMLA